MIYLQDVPFIVSLSTAAVTGCPGGCRLAVRQKCCARERDKGDRPCNIVTNVLQLGLNILKANDVEICSLRRNVHDVVILFTFWNTVRLRQSVPLEYQMRLWFS